MGERHWLSDGSQNNDGGASLNGIRIAVAQTHKEIRHTIHGDAVEVVSPRKLGGHLHVAAHHGLAEHLPQHKAR